MKVIMSVPDEGYSRNASCALNLISTFLCYEQMSFFPTRLKEYIIFTDAFIIVCGLYHRVWFIIFHISPI